MTRIQAIVLFPSRWSTSKWHFLLNRFSLCIILFLSSLASVKTALAIEKAPYLIEDGVSFYIVLDKNRVFTNEVITGTIIVQNNMDEPVNILSFTSPSSSPVTQNIHRTIGPYNSSTVEVEFPNLYTGINQVTVVIAYNLPGELITRRNVVNAPVQVLNWPGFNFDLFWPLLMGSMLTLGSTFILNAINQWNERRKNRRSAVGQVKTFCNCNIKYIDDFTEIPVDFWKKALLENPTLNDIREIGEKRRIREIDIDAVELLSLADKYNSYVKVGNPNSQNVREFISDFRGKINKLIQKLSVL